MTGAGKQVTDIQAVLSAQQAEDKASGYDSRSAPTSGSVASSRRTDRTRGAGSRAPDQDLVPGSMASPLSGSYAVHSYSWLRGGADTLAEDSPVLSGDEDFPTWLPSFEALDELCKAVTAPTRKIYLGPFGLAFAPAFMGLVLRRVAAPFAGELQMWKRHRYAALTLMETVSDVSMEIITRYDFDADEHRGRATLRCGLSLLRWGLAGVLDDPPVESIVRVSSIRSDTGSAADEPVPDQLSSWLADQ